jgi:hypothetical protein
MPDDFTAAAATPEPDVRVKVRTEQTTSDAIAVHLR